MKRSKGRCSWAGRSLLDFGGLLNGRIKFFFPIGSVQPLRSFEQVSNMIRTIF